MDLLCQMDPMPVSTASTTTSHYPLPQLPYHFTTERLDRLEAIESQPLPRPTKIKQKHRQSFQSQTILDFSMKVSHQMWERQPRLMDFLKYRRRDLMTLPRLLERILLPTRFSSMRTHCRH